MRAIETSARAGERDTSKVERFLSDATKALGSSLDPPSSLTTVAHLAIPQLADAYCVVTVENEGLRPIAWAHRNAEKQQTLDALFSSPHVPTTIERLAQDALHKSETIVIADATADHRFRQPAHVDDARLLAAVCPTSMIVVPIIRTGRKLGAFVFCYCESSRHYAPTDAGVFEELAHRAATALENARAYDDAKRAIANRDEILGIVAHDLKTPLASVLLAGQILQRMTDYEDVETVRKNVDIVVRSAKAMRRLISDLLDTASIHAGCLKLELSPTDVRALLEDVAESLLPLARKSGVELSTNTAEDVGKIVCDRDRVQEVLTNLLDNALKATASGGTIVLSAKRDAREIIVSVRDSGHGISSSELPNVFQRYWRSAHAGYTGTGRGLAIAKAVIEGHGGRIWAESERGVGSTFSFALPSQPSISMAPAMHERKES